MLKAVRDVEGMIEEQALPIQKAMAAAALAKLRDLAKPLCRGGVYAKPTEAQHEKLRSADPTNTLAESLFGLYDYLSTAIVNASHFTYSGMAAALKNQTVEWLRGLDEPLRHVLVLWSVKNRNLAVKGDQNKMKAENEAVLKKEGETIKQV